MTGATLTLTKTEVELLKCITGQMPHLSTRKNGQLYKKYVKAKNSLESAGLIKAVDGIIKPAREFDIIHYYNKNLVVLK